MSRRAEGKRLYEGMFLFDSAAGGKGEALTAMVLDLLTKKHGAEIVRVEQLGDRKLAYEVNGLKRGTYLLVYFRSEPGRVPEMERDLRLNEQVLRHMMIYHEKEPSALTKPAEEAAAPVEEPAAPAAPAST